MDEKIDYDNKNEEFDKLVRVQQEVLNEKDQLIRQLQHELSISRNDYEAISNATFWKATKPLRIICDELKENKIIAALLNRNNFESENYKFKKITILTTKCTLFVAKLINSNFALE